MSKRLCWTCLLVVGCGAVIKPPEPDRRLDVRVTGSVFETDHGFRFVVLPEPTAKVVQVDVRYPVGSADDPAGKAGLAHLVEHLLFEVEYSVGGNKTAIGAELGKVALASNAFTQADHTTYVNIATPDALDAVFGLEVNRLAIGCGGLTADIVAREREVVLNELRGRQGRAGGAIEQAIHDAVYPAGHPYRAVHSLDSVAKLELGDVCAFLAGPYQRGQASIVVSGAVDEAAVKQVAAKHLKRLRKRTADPRVALAAAPSRPGVETLRVDIDEPTLVATWPLPHKNTREYRLLELAWPAIAPRLEAFGYIYKWGYDANTRIIGGDRAPVLVVELGLTSMSKRDDAIDAAIKAVEFAMRNLGESKDTEKWKRVWQTRVESMLARWETLDGRNELAADAAAQGGVVGRISELAQSNPTETKILVEEWLGRSRARYLLLEPTGDRGVARTRTYRGGAEAHGVRVDPALADRPIAVPRNAPTLPAQRYRLPNGLQVVLWPHGTAPLVHGRLVIDSGNVHEPIGKEGMARLVGADDIHADSMVFEQRDLATEVDHLVRNLALELRSPGYGLDDDGKAYLRKRLQRTSAKERLDYERQLLVGAYGDHHPYARTSMTERTIDNIDHDSVMRWARGHVVAENATLIIAGKFDPALVKRHVAYNADHVTSGLDSRTLDAVARPKHGWVAGRATSSSPVVELDVLFPGGPGIDRDHAKRLLLEAVLDAKLTTLRTKQGVTYGMTSSYEPRAAGGLWRISGLADAVRATEAASEIASVLEAIRSDPESYRAEFVLARQQLIAQMLAMGSDSRGVVERLAKLARFDLPDDHYDKLVVSIGQLTLASFHPFVATELARDKQVFGAFGNDSVVTAAIAGAQKIEHLAVAR